MKDLAPREVLAVLLAYDKAINDPSVKIPTALHIAIEQLREKYAPRNAAS